MSSSDDVKTTLERAIATVPGGKYAVAVSGGADSVALLRLLATDRSAPRELVVVHLNHQTRGDASDEDERFVVALADALQLPCEIAPRASLERDDLPTNPSARYRAMRHALFARVIDERKLDGVILAHHADDQAETVMLRLLRGSGWPALAGMSPRAVVNGITILRPLLSVRGATLRTYLHGLGESWREDASNESSAYERNVVRVTLRTNDGLTDALIELADRCRALREWADARAPRLSHAFPIAAIADLPRVLQLHAIARWLVDRGISANDISQALLDRVVAMCTDASAPAKINLPRDLHARRRAGMIFIDEDGGRAEHAR